jgi:hypothetical protein
MRHLDYHNTAVVKDRDVSMRDRSGNRQSDPRERKRGNNGRNRSDKFSEFIHGLEVCGRCLPFVKRILVEARETQLAFRPLAQRNFAAARDFDLALFGFMTPLCA